VADLVRLLFRGNFLEQRYVDVPSLVQSALHPRPAWRSKLSELARTLSIEWAGAERLVVWLYRRFLRHLFIRAGAVATLVLSLVGLATFFDTVASHRFHLNTVSVGLGFVILFLLNLAIVFIHELGHAAVLVRYRRRIKSAGFRIYFGSPAFFIESSDALLLDRRQRIHQAFAGPYFEFVASGVGSILLWLFPHASLAPILFRFCVLNYFLLLLNLVPLLELDGYWILSDALDMPDLRPRSLAFTRHELVPKLLRRERFDSAEIGLTLYGTVGVVFTIFCFGSAYFFWKRTFGGLVSRMWHGGPVGIVLLVILAAFLAGPVIRAAWAAARGIGRLARVRWQSLRFRAERRWRIEAATLLDSQPVFEDLPTDVLNKIAGRVRLKSVGPYRSVVRQGERADAYYLVRRGDLEIVEEDGAAGTDRLLRRLGPGDGFGEMGLAAGAARNATVRTISRSELFVVDKGHFERLLADHLVLPDIEPTLRHLDELAELPVFSHLAPKDLAGLAHAGRWVNFAPSAVLMEQGDPGYDFYVLAAGQVEIIQEHTRVDQRGPGDHVGELALLLDAPRNATVRALTPVRAYCLGRAGFDRLVRTAFTQANTLRVGVPFNQAWDH
jgi:CRP-like cAMP-binding protein/Zn-dependent protease